MTGMGFVRRWKHDARTASELAIVRPAYAGGVRAAIATVVPLLFAGLLPGGGASWMSLAGLNGALIDRGGPYRTRAVTMSALGVASAIVMFAGSLVGGHLALAAIVTFAIAIACGLARAWTDVGPGFGVTILVTYAIAVALPADSVSAALLRAAFIAAGALWAMFIALLLWPIRPYRPVRLRVAECYRATARYLAAAVSDVDTVTLRPYVVAVRAAIEAARTSLAVLRRGRGSETKRGEKLLVLHEIADQMFVHLIALFEESDAIAPEARLVLVTALDDVGATAREIADAIEAETSVARIAVAWNGDAMRPVSPALAELIDRLADYATAAASIIAALKGDSPIAVANNIDVSEPPSEPVLFSLRAVIRPSSVVLHHALRVALVTTIAVLIGEVLKLNHGYWITLTAIVILQPYAATTRQKALQRVGGTILGGIVAAGLTAIFQSQIAILVLVATFTMLCVALLPLNYGAYAVFGTPAFVLLAEMSASDWHLAGTRIVNTLIGGALALAGAQLLWPSDEEDHLPEYAAAALRANRELLRRALAFVTNGGEADVGSLRDARRDIANAALNAEDSFQRLISEHRGPPEALEPIMAFLVLTRRIAASSASLAIAAANGARVLPDQLRQFSSTADSVLSDLERSITAAREPATFPPPGSAPLPDAAAAPIVHQKLVRISRQLKLLHDSVARWKRDEIKRTSAP